MITFMSSWPGRLFSSDIPDLRFSIAFERALVTVEVLKNGSVETAFSELLYPDNDNQICLSDIDLLVQPYSDRYVVFDVRVTVQEQNVYSSDHVSVIDTQTVSASVVTCKAIVKNMTAADFCNNRFLTLLDGTKQTAGGWKEILSYIGNDTPVCEATYDDGSVVTHQVTRLSEGDFTMIDVSPDNFLSSGLVTADRSLWLSVTSRRISALSFCSPTLSVSKRLLTAPVSTIRYRRSTADSHA